MVMVWPGMGHLDFDGAEKWSSNIIAAGSVHADVGFGA